jgi:hypothetical protein
MLPKFWDSDTLSQNVSNQLPTYTIVTAQKSEDLTYIIAQV